MIFKSNENDLDQNQTDKRVPATLMQRFFALFIDRLLCFIFLLCISYTEFFSPDFSLLFKIIKLFEQMIPTAVIYHIIFELCWNGQTPGKKICQIRVVTENYEPLNITIIFTRNFLRFCDVIPIFYIAGIVSILNSKKRQRMGDISAGTLVVCEESIDDEIPASQILPDNNSEFSSNPTENIYNQKD